MTRLEKLEHEIEALTPFERSALLEWLESAEWEAEYQRRRQIVTDEALADEALADDELADEILADYRAWKKPD
jgi:arsenate reductase-like glutaredoxin family protein